MRLVFIIIVQLYFITTHKVFVRSITITESLVALSEILKPEDGCGWRCFVLSEIAQ